jgi:hypothetical protein
MGYRSDVAFVIRFEKPEDRDTYLALHLTKADIETNEALRYIKKLDEDKLFFHETDWKWYDGYATVDKLTEFYQGVTKMFEDSAYLFYRVGEDLEDIEQSDDGDVDDLWDYIGVHKYIHIEVDETQLEAVMTTEGELA